MTQTPSIGRIVHYLSRGSADGHYQPETRAAIITELYWSDAADAYDWQGEYQLEIEGDSQAEQYIAGISLCILNPNGMFFDENVEYSEQPRPGYWSWPPRVS